MAEREGLRPKKSCGPSRHDGPARFWDPTHPLGYETKIVKAARHSLQSAGDGFRSFLISVFGMHVCLKVGLPEAVAHIAVGHSFEGQFMGVSTECMIVRQADHGWRHIAGALGRPDRNTDLRASGTRDHDPSFRTRCLSCRLKQLPSQTRLPAGDDHWRSVARLPSRLPPAVSASDRFHLAAVHADRRAGHPAGAR